jgi:hypothetical protein
MLNKKKFYTLNFRLENLNLKDQNLDPNLKSDLKPNPKTLKPKPSS